MENRNPPTVHRGICYSVRKLEGSIWQWEVLPPITAVKGYRRESGKISGGSQDAILAAKKAIDAQQDDNFHRGGHDM